MGKGKNTYGKDLESVKKLIISFKKKDLSFRDIASEVNLQFPNKPVSYVTVRDIWLGMSIKEKESLDTNLKNQGDSESITFKEAAGRSTYKELCETGRTRIAQLLDAKTTSKCIKEIFIALQLIKNIEDLVKRSDDELSLINPDEKKIISFSKNPILDGIIKDKQKLIEKEKSPDDVIEVNKVEDGSANEV